MLDSDNPIVQLCAAAEEQRVAGNLERARELLRQAWEDASAPWERAVAAHYVAGIQPMPAGSHHWHRTAMDEARLAEAEDPNSVRELWPSLHLAFAGSLEAVGSPERAAGEYRDALEAALALGAAGEGYARAAEDGLRRVGGGLNQYRMFEGPHRKLQRAWSQIDSLRSDEEGLRSELACEVVCAEAEDGDVVLRALVNSVPHHLRWGVCMGEILHNLRSALDGLVWDVAPMEVRHERGRSLQFPIFNSEQAYNANRRGQFGAGLRMIEGLPHEYRDLVESLQPFKHPTDSPHALWVLHQLNNADKHRTLTITTVRPAMFGGDIGVSRAVFDFRASLWESSSRVGVIPNESWCSFQVSMTPQIAFDESTPVVPRRGVVITLMELADEIRQVIERFERVGQG